VSGGIERKNREINWSTRRYGSRILRVKGYMSNKWDLEGENYGVDERTIFSVTQWVYYLHDCTAASTDIFLPVSVP
jgi:hypothetical protein